MSRSRRRAGSSPSPGRRSAAASAAVCCILTAGCLSGTQLVDERSLPPFAGLVRADRALESRRFLLRGQEQWIHAREVSSGSTLAARRPVLVLLNGVFSDGGTWRFVTGPLAEHFDLLVMDLPGTGLSCGDDPDAQPESTFTLRWVGREVFSALASWQLQQASPRKMILIGHSLAGAAILRMLGDPTLRAESPRELSLSVGAVLIGTADVGTSAWSPVLIELAKLTDAEVSIGGALGILDSKVEDGVVKSVQHPERTAFALEVERMVDALEDRDRRRASQLMLRRIRPIDDDDEPVWPAVRVLSADHGRVEVPVLLLWGREDDILPLVATAEKLRSEIPGSQLVVIDDARHSVHQEEPVATANAIIRFVDGVTARPSVDGATR